MPDGRVTILPFSREQLRALIDGELKRQQDQAKFREQIAEINRVEDPARQAWRQHELLIQVACDCFGASPDDFLELTAAASTGGSIAALVANLDCGVEIGKNERQRPAAMKLALWASCRVVDDAAPFGATERTRLPYDWLMETLAGGEKRLSRRVAEAAALSVLFFEGPPPGAERSLSDGGKWLTAAARDIAAELKRRGVARTPGELVRYREDIDCDNHRHAMHARVPVSFALSAQRLAAYRDVPPEPKKVARKTHPRKQRYYERVWPVAEEHLKGLVAQGRDRSDAAWLTVELVLSLAAPAPAGLSVKANNIQRRRAGGGGLRVPRKIPKETRKPGTAGAHIRAHGWQILAARPRRRPARRAGGDACRRRQPGAGGALPPGGAAAQASRAARAGADHARRAARPDVPAAGSARLRFRHRGGRDRRADGAGRCV